MTRKKKKRDGSERLGRLVQRTKPDAVKPSAKGKKAAGQFGRRAAAKTTAQSPSLSNEERMLRAIRERD